MKKYPNSVWQRDGFCMCGSGKKHQIKKCIQIRNKQKINGEYTHICF